MGIALPSHNDIKISSESGKELERMRGTTPL
jgi:hypothetical protein